jgi:hypothetical protein
VCHHLGSSENFPRTDLPSSSSKERSRLKLFGSRSEADGGAVLVRRHFDVILQGAVQDGLGWAASRGVVRGSSCTRELLVPWQARLLLEKSIDPSSLSLTRYVEDLIGLKVVVRIICAWRSLGCRRVAILDADLYLGTLFVRFVI